MEDCTCVSQDDCSLGQYPWCPKNGRKWAQFYHEEGPNLYRYAYRLLGNQDDAEDCLQMTFEAFFSRAENFDRSKPLIPYFRGIIKRSAFKIKKKRFFEIILHMIYLEEEKRK